MPFQPKLSARIQRVKPSATLAISAKAKQMQADGIDVVGFGAGEPDFDTPVPVKDAAKRALDEGFTKYTVVSGIPDLKSAIIKKFDRDNKLSYKPSEIIVSVGGKHSFFNWAMACLEKGDEVIIPAPYWVSYPDMVSLADATPVIVQTTEASRFKMTPDQLARAITPNTRGVILNSPSNPTGMGYSEAELRALAEVVLKHPNVLMISDEIYEPLTYGGFKHVSVASFSPEHKAQTLVLNGVSKAYSMTGWRIGYAAGNEQIVGAMTKLQEQSTSNPASISQKAAAFALTMDQSVVGEMCAAFDKRRDYIVNRINKIPGVRCLNPDGAFYIFPNLSHYFGCRFNGKVIADMDALAGYFLDSAHVALVAGGSFGGPECARLSFCTSMEQITKGLDRIEAALAKLEKP